MAWIDEERWAVKRWVGSHSKLRAVRNCGHRPMPNTNSIQTRVYKNTAGDTRLAIHGVTWCNSVWACPDCSRNLARRRATYLTALIKAWFDDGNQVAMITLTMRHNANMPLDQIIETAAAGNPTYGLGQKYGVLMPYQKCKTLRFARAAEITHGKNGWHYHQHFLAFLPGWCDAADLEDIRHRMWTRWNTNLETNGYDSDEKQSDARFFHNAEEAGYYMIKAGLEVASGTTKHGRQENKTPFQILGDIMAHTKTCPRQRHDREHCPDYITNRDLWHEYELATKGRRQLIMPIKLGDYYGIDREHLDHHLETGEQPELDQQIMDIIGQPANALRSSFS